MPTTFRSDADEPHRSLLVACTALFRHKGKIIGFFVLTMAVASLITFVPPSIYRSEASLLVRVGRENVFLEATSSAGRVVSVGQSRESELNSELALLRSRDLAEQLVKALGPDAVRGRHASGATGTPAGSAAAAEGDDEESIAYVMKKLGVELVKGSNVISATYDSEDPVLARTALEKLIQLYLEKHIQAYRTSGSYAFFVEQTEQARTKLEHAEDEYRDLKNQSGVASLDDQRRITLGELGTRESEAGQILADLSAAKSHIADLEEQLKNPADVTRVQRENTTSPEVDDIRRKLSALAIEEEDLLAKFQPESSRVQDVRVKIAKMQELLNTAILQQVKSDLYAETLHVRSLDAKLAAVQQGAGSERAKRDVLINVETRLSQLEREIAIDAANYREYASKLEQARISNALENERISNISVVEAPTLPLDAVSPRKALNMILGFLVAIIGGIGIAFIAEYFDHLIRLPMDVDLKLGLRTLVTIPLLPKDAVFPVIHADPSGLSRGGGPREGATRVSTNWAVHPDAKSYYDILQSRMFVYGDGSLGPPGVVAVTSCYRGEGVSVVASNLAATLAGFLQGPVLLVDAEAAQDYVGTNALAMSTNLLRAGTDRTALELGPHRPRTVNEGFLELKTQYRFIVIDAPAALDDTTAVRLARHVDGVIFVIESGRVHAEVAKHTVTLLQHANAKLLGAVINKRQFYLPHWLYRRL